MNKGVVYTCLFGSKEPVQFKRHQDSTVDHVIFSDQKIEIPSDCRLVLIDTSDIGPERLSRKPKLLPHRFLSNYEWSLYIDNNIELKAPPEKIAEQYLSATDVSFVSFRHPSRTCLYTEAEVVISWAYDKESVVREQIDF